LDTNLNKKFIFLFDICQIKSYSHFTHYIFLFKDFIMTDMVPALVLTYGPSGCGKTTDCGYSFPNALFIAARGALQSVTHTCGYSPAQIECKTIDDATKTLLDLQKKGGNYDAVVVDDFSFLAEQTMAVYEKKYSGFTLWGKLRDATLDFRNAARYSKCHVVLNCWEQAPKTRTDGSFVRGGPMLSGKLPEQMPAMCDLVLRSGEESMRRPWKGIYRCNYNSKYVMKDRFGVCYNLSPAPMNLGEILRSAGYTISRLKSLSWQEEAVEAFSTELENVADPYSKANELFGLLLAKGIDPKAAKWTLRDAMDRMVIRRTLHNTNARFVV
jgi:hypothetical protein